MTKFLTELNQMLWGKGLIGLLLGTGVFCLFCRNGECLKSFRLLFRKRKEKSSSGIPVFQSCMTSLGAAMGTGNIVGVASALTLGGAGAVFWMWVSAFSGMGLIYAENVLSCHYRKKHCYGTSACFRYGLKSPALAGIFAFCCVLASFGMGNMAQSHAMAEILNASFQIPAWMTGILTMLVLYIIISGGSGRISKVSAVIIPFLTGLYLLCILIIFVKFKENLFSAFGEIFRKAFDFRAVTGGTAGYAVSAGIRRGIFSNEAGLGSSGLLHGEANSENPEFLGLCGMLEVIADTFLCCTATALAILCTGALQSETDNSVLVLNAFRLGIGSSADFILPPVTALFAFGTLIGWSYCGLNALKTLTQNKKFLKFYQILFCISAFAGAVMKLELVWTLADIANACMAYCNLPAILLLYPEMKKCCTA